MLINGNNGYFYVVDFQVFDNFTVTFVIGFLFRAKKHPETKSCSRKKIEILELCCRTFFFSESCLESGKNTDFSNFRPLVLTVVEFPWNDPS
jgi:hypothetical protein